MNHDREPCRNSLARRAAPAFLLLASLASLSSGPLAHALRAQPPDRPAEAVQWAQAPDVPSPLDEASQEAWKQRLERARVGKYKMLLAQVSAPEAAAKEGEFRDAGVLNEPPVTGHEGAGGKGGFWVYAAPCWYHWRDQVAAPLPPRHWGPEQATGEPNTPDAGDIPTAWASRTPDAGSEWLLLEYEKPVAPRSIVIHESFNTGAVSRVTAFALDGREVEIYNGADALGQAAGRGVFEVRLKTSMLTNRIKLYIDSAAVPGWNEIDAVGLVDAEGKAQWATSAAASSTFAEPEILPGRLMIERLTTAHIDNTGPAAPADPNETLEQRVARLEAQVRQLQAQLEALTQPDPATLHLF